jgi:transcriptional regulator GlxA family with amidase domain
MSTGQRPPDVSRSGRTGIEPQHQVAPDDQAAMLAGHGVVRAHVVVAICVLRSRLAERWTLNALADEVHLSRSQLVRAFDAAVGISPMTYLRQMRAHQMAQLLGSTDLSVAECARLVGWTDARYASRCFRTVYDLSPTEFRRRPPPLLNG